MTHHSFAVAAVAAVAAGSVVLAVTATTLTTRLLVFFLFLIYDLLLELFYLINGVVVLLMAAHAPTLITVSAGLRVPPAL